MELVGRKVLRRVCRDPLRLHNEAIIRIIAVVAAVDGRTAQRAVAVVPARIAEGDGIARGLRAAVLGIAAIDCARDRAACERDLVVDGIGMSDAARDGKGIRPRTDYAACECHLTARCAARNGARADKAAHDRAAGHRQRIRVRLRRPRRIDLIRPNAAVGVACKVNVVDDKGIARHCTRGRGRTTR